MEPDRDAMEGNGSLEEIFTFGYWLYAVILRSHLLDPMLKVVRHDLVGYNETQKKKAALEMA